MGAVPPWSGRKRNDRFRAVGLLERTSEVLWTRRYVLAKLAWPRGASPMTIIDSQVHAYEAHTAKRPWHSVPNWPDNVPGDEMVAARATFGLEAATLLPPLSITPTPAPHAQPRP